MTGKLPKYLGILTGLTLQLMQTPINKAHYGLFKSVNFKLLIVEEVLISRKECGSAVTAWRSYLAIFYGSGPDLHIEVSFFQASKLERPT